MSRSDFVNFNFSLFRHIQNILDFSNFELPNAFSLVKPELQVGLFLGLNTTEYLSRYLSLADSIWLFSNRNAKHYPNKTLHMLGFFIRENYSIEMFKFKIINKMVLQISKTIAQLFSDFYFYYCGFDFKIILLDELRYSFHFCYLHRFQFMDL